MPRTPAQKMNDADSNSSELTSDNSTYQSQKRSTPVTLADIAAEAGVSLVSVSVALNGSKSRARVSEETRVRIQKVARTMGYRPNAIARSLRSRSTNIIGFYNAQPYVLGASNPFYGAIMRGLERGCEDYKKDMLIHGVLRGASENEILAELSNGKIDGLVLYASETSDLTRQVAEANLPVVSIVNQVEGIPCVLSDDVKGGQLLAAHLVDRGYSRVMYRRLRNQSPTLMRRLESFRETAERLGLSITFTEVPSRTGLSEQEEELMTAPPDLRPDVIVGYNDATADDAVEYCRSVGLRVPHDVAVVGYDGLGAQWRPARNITSVKANWELVARTAVSLLVASCAGETIAMRTVVPVSLEVGETT